MSEVLMTGSELLDFQLALECKGFDEAGDVVRVGGDEPDDISPVAVAHLGDDYRLLVRADLPADVRAALRRLPLAEVFIDPTPLVETVANGLQSVDWRRLRSGVVRSRPRTFSDDGIVTLDNRTRDPLQRFFEPGFATLAVRRPVFAVMDGDRVLAACTSSRENNHAGEAWVATEPEFRRRGLARRCVAAWASSLIQSGKVPFYSHDVSNAGSQAVAEVVSVEYWLSSVVVNAK